MFLMILTSIINILNIVSAWKDKASGKSELRFKSAEASLQDHHGRLIALEEAAKRTPTHGDLERVYDSINGLAKTVHQLFGQNERQTQLLNQLVNKAIDGKCHDH